MGGLGPCDGNGCQGRGKGGGRQVGCVDSVSRLPKALVEGVACLRWGEGLGMAAWVWVSPRESDMEGIAAVTYRAKLM